jgi:hypothetical protein
MALPTLAVSKYDVTLPISGKKFTARPFLVKEEKVLMTAFESREPAHIVAAIIQIIKDCVFEEIHPLQLPLVDMEFLIIKLKSFSRGESIDLTMKCGNMVYGPDSERHPCGHETDIAVSLEHLGENMDASKILPASIKLSELIGINLRPPRFGAMTYVLDSEMSESDRIMHVLVDSIESIWSNEEVYLAEHETYESLEAFIGEMDTSQFKKLRDYFKSIPNVSLKEDFTCPECKHHEIVNVRDLNDFFV